MKKLLVILSVAGLIMGCGIVPDVDGMKDVLENQLQVKVIPVDDGEGLDVEITGFPEEMPQGFDGVDIYVSDADITQDSPGEKLNDEPLTDDTTLSKLELENGTEYFVGGGADAGGEDVIHGFGGGFYPRPGGFGSFLGGALPGEQEGFIFDRETGVPANMTPDETVDFYFFQEGNDYFISSAVPLGGDTLNGVVAAGETEDNWLDVTDAPENFEDYSHDPVKIEKDQVYQLILNKGEHYAKIAIQDIATDTTAYFAESMKVWIRYAFQTAKHVGHY